MATTPRQFRIPDSTYDPAMEIAKERGESLAAVVNAALERYVEDYRGKPAPPSRVARERAVTIARLRAEITDLLDRYVDKHSDVLGADVPADGAGGGDGDDLVLAPAFDARATPPDA